MNTVATNTHHCGSSRLVQGHLVRSFLDPPQVHMVYIGGFVLRVGWADFGEHHMQDHQAGEGAVPCYQRALVEAGRLASEAEFELKCRKSGRMAGQGQRARVAHWVRLVALHKGCCHPGNNLGWEKSWQVVEDDHPL